MIKKIFENHERAHFLTEFSLEGTLLREESYSTIGSFGGPCRKRWAYIERGSCLFKAAGVEIFAKAGTVIEQFQEGRLEMEILEAPLKILSAWVLPEGFEPSDSDDE